MPTLDKTIAHLQHLQSTCRQARRTCRQFAAGKGSAQLRHFLGEREREHEELLACLHTQITTYGGRPAWRLDLAHFRQRCWLELKMRAPSGDDRARLETTSRLESLLRRRFENLLAQELATPFRQQLSEHHQRALQRARQLQAARDDWPLLDVLAPSAAPD